MSDDIQNKLSLDANEYINEMKELDLITQKTGITIDRFTKSTTEYNKNASQLERQIKGLTSSGKEFLAVFNNVGKLKEFKLTDTGNLNELKETAKVMQDLAQKQKELALAQAKAAREATKLAKQQAKEVETAEVAAIKQAMLEAKIAYLERKRLAKELETAQKQQAAAEVAGIKEAMAAAVTANIVRKQGAKELALAQANSAVNNISAKFGAGIDFNNISASSLSKINSALLKVQSTLNSGKATANEYNEVFSRLANGSLNTLTAKQQVLLADILKVRDAFNSARQPVKLLGDIFDDTGKKGDDSGKSVLLSWRGVFRLFIVQTLHQSLNALLNLFRSGANDAAKFSVAIGEIQTISQQTNTTYRQLNDSLVEVANRFGSDQLDIARAGYEAISNQVANATNVTNVLSEALKFSIVTQTDAKTATNLLSSAINSYKLKTSEAERVSAVFFEIINLGRVRAEEMGDTFGRVGTLAAQMGISLEEVGASITVLTRQGVRYSEAYTLINNVVLKLLKPTGEFKDLLNEYGFASGEAAVKTVGFGNVLKILDTEAAKGNARLGELLDEMRAIRGAIGLTGEGLQEFNKDLAQIEGAEAITRYRKALDLVNQTSGREFLVNTQRIKNYFTNVFGNAFITASNDVIDFFGGAANAASLFSKSLFALISTATIYLTTIKVANFSTELFKAGLLSVRGAAGLAAAAVSTLALVYQKSLIDAEAAKAKALEVYNGMAEARDRYLQRVNDSIDNEFKKYSNTLKDVSTVTGTVAAEINKKISQMVKNNEASLKTFKDALDQYFDSLEEGSRDALSRVSDNAREFERELERTKNDIERLNKDIVKDELDRKITIAETPQDQVKVIQEHIEALKKLKSESKGNAKAEIETQQEIIDATKRLFDLTSNIRRSATTEAERLGEQQSRASRQALEKERDAAAQLATQIRQQLRSRQGDSISPTNQRSLEKRLEQAEQKRREADAKLVRGADSSNTASTAKQQEVELNAELVKLQQEKVTLLEREAKLTQAKVDAEKLEKQKREDDNKFLKNTLTDVRKFDVSKVTSPEELKQKFDEFQKQITSVQTLNPVDQQNLVDAVNKYRLEAEKTLQTKILAERANSEAISIAKASEAAQTELNNFKDVSKQNAAEIKQAYDQIASSLTAIVENDKGLFDGIVGKSKGMKQLIELQQTIKAKADDATTQITPEVLARLEQASKILKEIGPEIRDRASGNLFGTLNQNPLVNGVEGVRTFGKEVAKVNDATLKLIEEFKKTPEIKLDIADAETKIEALDIRAKQLGDKFKIDLPPAVDSGLNAIGNKFDTFITKLDASITRLINLANAIPREGRGFNFGGFTFYNSGGRGLDRHPAMLRADEFIMNSAATRRNFSQFQALNAGNTPRHFNSGGSVTNVGDVNVTVVGGDSSQSTIREIGDGLRRQIRLNRFKF